MRNQRSTTKTNKNEHPTIPPRSVVRCVGVILFLLSAAIMFILLTNLAAIHLGVVILGVFGAVTTMGFSLKAITTGNPEWILLDLIFWY